MEQLNTKKFRTSNLRGATKSSRGRLIAAKSGALWRFINSLVGSLVLSATLIHAATADASFINEYHRTLTVNPADKVKLDVNLPNATLQISNGRNDQISLTVAASGDGLRMDSTAIARLLTVEQQANQVRVSAVTGGPDLKQLRLVCSIEVPFRTEVQSVMERGRAAITGILGPVNARAVRGDIEISYVSGAVVAETGSGNLSLNVIGERVEARTGDGRISCTRVARGVAAETQRGDISLQVVGPSSATVKTGSGRIEVGGARGEFHGSTADGDLHIKAIPHDTWRLDSSSGKIFVELPHGYRFDLQIHSRSGDIWIDRDDIEKQSINTHLVSQQVNGGGKLIEIHNDRGAVEIH